jgi:proteic killer suppression protein
LDVRFRTRKLQRICNSQAELKRHFGDMAEVIMNRLQVLARANHLGQVPHTKPTRRHQLSGARREQFAVDLLHPYRLVFRPDHNPLPQRLDGGVDLNAVIAIEIIEIIDYH